MTPDELRTSLRVICWSQSLFARVVGVRENSVRRWLNGENNIPDTIATPLRALAEAHRANPFPGAPEEGAETWPPVPSR